MWKVALTLLWVVVGIILFALLDSGHAQTKVGEVSTTFNVGVNDKIKVDRFDDPKIENVSCYVSRAIKGGSVTSWAGVAAMAGFAEDPSNMSIACRATGKVKIVGKIEKSIDGELVFSESASPLFKTVRVTRFYDTTKNVLIYLVWSTKVVDGSPFNAVTAVAID